MTLPAVRSGAPLNRWDPFREFDDLYGQLTRWMDEVNGPFDRSFGGWAPLADVTETDDAFEVELDVPGVKREDVAIDLNGTELLVTGELKERQRAGLLRRRTRRAGRFTYRLTLPNHVDTDKVEASLDDGVLTIRVPKAETAKPRRIEITGKK
jgi:HSP20 family protein